MDSKPRVRFAPSPTGNLHIGGVRTALFNYLFSRKNEGTFILRLEDTDRTRSRQKFEDSILQGLRWLGLDWDEGPDKGGDYGPYRQSERFDLYQGIVEKLLQEDKAYYCFCTPDELEEKRQQQKKAGQPPRYDGTCAQLSKSETEQRLNENKSCSVRFRTPEEVLSFDDHIRGTVEFDTSLLGDMVLMKSDGTPTFNFACAVDDWKMKITHVIRGEDHISNTPKQILIARGIGASPPEYAHLPMILGKDRSKLSKRHGATNVIEFRTLGYLPSALTNFLALLGWSHPGEKEVLSREELIENFSLERVGKSASIFDTGKLDWLNHHYIQQLPEEEYIQMAHQYLPEHASSEYSEEQLRKILLQVRDSISLFTELPRVTEYFFHLQDLTPQARAFIEDLPFTDFCRHLFSEMKKNPVHSMQDLLPLLKKAGKACNLKGKHLYMSLRIAVTGTNEGVELQPLLEILGIERIQSRIQKMVQYLEKRSESKE